MISNHKVILVLFLCCLPGCLCPCTIVSAKIWRKFGVIDAFQSAPDWWSSWWGWPCLGAHPALNCWHLFHQQWARGKSRLSLPCAALFWITWAPSLQDFSLKVKDSLTFGVKLEILHIAFCCYSVLPPADAGEGWRGPCHSPLHIIRTCDDKNED